MEGTTVNHTQSLKIGAVVNYYPESGDHFARRGHMAPFCKLLPAMVMAAEASQVLHLRVWNFSDESARMRYDVAHKSKAKEGQAYWDYPQPVVEQKEAPKTDHRTATTKPEYLHEYLGIETARVDELSKELMPLLVSADCLGEVIQQVKRMVKSEAELMFCCFVLGRKTQPAKPLIS